MTSTFELEHFYREYIDCLNRQDWLRVGCYVHESVSHNGRLLGLEGYRAMLAGDFARIPDLHFEVQLLVAQAPMLASRLRFDVTPRGEFLGLPVNGRRICFTENVFYELQDGKIREVWSILDKAAVEAQLRVPG